MFSFIKRQLRTIWRSASLCAFSKDYRLKTIGYSRGFSLVEMVVAIGIFIVAILIITSALVGAISASQKAQSIRSAMDNLGSGIDSMTRLMRFGNVYHCGCVDGAGALVDCDASGNPTATPAAVATAKDCPVTSTGGGGGQFIAFERPEGDLSNPNDQIVFRRALWPGTTKGRIERSDASGVNDPTKWYAVTGQNVDIKELNFFVAGTQPDNAQPSASFVIRGVASPGTDSATDFSVQTTVTMRAPNFSSAAGFGFRSGSNSSSCVPEYDPVNDPTGSRCTDGIDNNCNGLKDCADWAAPSCMGTPYCQEICYDNIDNDNNGDTDCRDFTPCGAYGLPWQPVLPADPKYGVPGYHGCQEIGDIPDPSYPGSGTVLPFMNSGVSDSQCGNGADDNGIALGASPSATYLSAPSTLYGADCADAFYCRYDISGKCKENCHNGIDDNGNGLTDCQEWPQCGGWSGIDPTDPSATFWDCNEGANCNDGKDNDMNGLTDCLDVTQCSTAPNCITDTGPIPCTGAAADCGNQPQKCNLSTGFCSGSGSDI